MKRSLVYGLSWPLLMVSAIALGAAACSPEERNFGDSSSSSSSSGAGGNGGSAMACKPDETEACYNGPAETLEVGVCKGGTHVCLPGGEGFGECGGEVLPTVENCLTPEDEACNGNDPKECPTLADGWLEAFGTAGSGQYVHALAITNTGDIVVVGSFGDTLDFGMGPMASTGSSDIFVAKFDQLGKVIWNRRFGDASSQSAFAVGVDSMGAIYVGGSMVGNVDFDGTLLTSAGSADAFLARFDPDGKLVWAKNWGDINPQYVRHIEVTKTNLIIVAGEFGGTIQFDANGQNKLTAVGGSDVFVARFDTSGFLSGSRGFGGTFNDSVRGLALDSANRVYLTGGYDGTANFGGPMLTSTGARDGYVVALTATLNTTSAFGFGNPNGPNSYQEAYDVVVNDIDEVIVSGGFTEGLELPGQFLSNSDPLSRSMFLAQFAPQLGSVTLAKQFGGVGGSVNDARLAIDPVAKQLVIAGAFTGDMDFGGGLLHAEAAADPYFAKLAADGAFVAARLLPNEVAVIDNPNNISCLALLPVGDLIIGGTLRTPILHGNKAVGTIDAKDGNALLGRFLH